MGPKMRKGLLLFFTVLFATGAGCLVAGQAPDIGAGKKIYAEHCSPCHGENAIGQDPKRQTGGWDLHRVPIAPALNGSAHAWHHSPQYLFKYIEKGSVDKDSPMPAFGRELGRREILSVLAYIQALWPEPIRKRYLAKYN